MERREYAAEVLVRREAIGIAIVDLFVTEFAPHKAARESNRAECAGDGARGGTRHHFKDHTVVRDTGLAALVLPLPERLEQEVEDARGIDAGGDRSSEHQTELEWFAARKFGRVTLNHDAMP